MSYKKKKQNLKLFFRRKFILNSHFVEFSLYFCVFKLCSFGVVKFWSFVIGILSIKPTTFKNNSVTLKYDLCTIIM